MIVIEGKCLAKEAAYAIESFREGAASLEDTLKFTKQPCSSLVIHWGENDYRWKIVWVVDGKEYSGYHQELIVAVVECLARWFKTL